MYRAVRLAALALASALILPASAAQAKGGACLPDYPHGAHCHVWTGKVKQVDDGDTLDASVPGDGLGGILRVRIIGIQAMELTSYRDRLARGRLPRGRRHASGSSSWSSAPRARSASARSTPGAARAAAGCARSRSAAAGAGATSAASSSPRASPCGGRGSPRTPRTRATACCRRRRRPRTRASSPPTRAAIGPNQGHPIGLWAQWDARRQRPRRRQRRVREDPQLRRQQLAAARPAGTCATRACGASPSRPAPPSRRTAP